MNKIKAGDPITQSEDIVKQNLETIKALFPTIVKEGKIDVEEFKALIGDEVEQSDEYYRFTWAGKSMARREANKPTTATLRPNKADSQDWDTTQNIFIEGDNLEVLKLLQKSYADKIKMIYIDPPYNTGNDFVYKDDYADNLGNYLAVTGQTDNKGKKTSTNTESDGRYHSNWLSMIYPRLKLARNLLKDEGVIFISIDDNEESNLRKLCNEVFGEENFVGDFIWHSRQNVDSRSLNGASIDHEYILCYVKTGGQRIRGKEIDKDKYTNPDNDPRGDWMSSPMDGIATKDKRPNLHYTIVNAETGLKYDPSPENGWRFQRSTVDELIKDKRVIWPKNPNSKPRFKRYVNELNNEFTGFSSMLDVDFTSQGTKELREIMGMETLKFPKPISLIKTLLEQGSEKESIVLDFFAGSGTTAHAVLKLNSEDGGNRKFICVQLPEKLDKESDASKAGFETIASITKERIRRAGEKIKSENKKDLFNGSNARFDIGFKAFKLDSSNIIAWDGNPENFENNLFNSTSNIKEGRTEDDVLFEILLKNGLDLTLPIEEKVIAGKKVFNIGAGALFICLADNITTAVAEGIGKWVEALTPSTCKVIFKDNGFTDVEKTNSIQILKRYGVTDVNSI